MWYCAWKRKEKLDFEWSDRLIFSAFFSSGNEFASACLLNLEFKTPFLVKISSGVGGWFIDHIEGSGFLCKDFNFYVTKNNKQSQSRFVAIY